jgi:hypothetical protein
MVRFIGPILLGGTVWKWRTIYTANRLGVPETCPCAAGAFSKVVPSFTHEIPGYVRTASSDKKSAFFLLRRI